MLLDRHSRTHFSQVEKRIIYILFALLFIHLLLKATWMGLFIDEVYTYYFYLQEGKVLPPEALVDANNHLLNSQLSLWSYELFGNSPLALRLPNVVSFILFYFAVFNISSRWKTPFVRWMIPIAIISCGFFYDYFAMCRGYGLSMGLFAGSLWMLFNYQESRKNKHLIRLMIMLWFAVSASLTVLVYALLILTLSLIFILINKSSKNWKAIVIWLVGSLSFLAHISWSLHLKDAEVLVHGNLSGFVSTTLESLSLHLFGFYHWILAVLAILTFAAMVALSLRKIIIYKWQAFESPVGILSFILIGAIAIIILLAKTLEVNYPQDRTAMHLFLLFLLCLGAWMDHFQSKKIIPYSLSVLAFFPLQFLWNIHPQNSQNFDIGRHSEKLYSAINEVTNPFDFPLTISSRGIQQVPWYYTNLRNGSKGPLPSFQSYPNMESDLVLWHENELDAFAEPIQNIYTEISKDPFTGNALYLRNQPKKRSLIEENLIPQLQNEKHEFYNFLIRPIDSLEGRSLYVGLDFELEAKEAPFKSRIIFSIDGEDGNLFQDFIDLYWLKLNYSFEDYTIHQGLIVQLPQGSKTLTVYLWNQDKTEFSIRNGKCYLYELEENQ